MLFLCILLAIHFVFIIYNIVKKYRTKGKNMITSIIGYPKVGSLRELKFATEKYFRNEIDLQQLQECAGNIKSTQWKMLKEKGFGNEKMV